MLKTAYSVEYVLKTFYNHREHAFSLSIKSESEHGVEHENRVRFYNLGPWWVLSGLPIYVLAVLYTTCWRAAHLSSGVELSLSSHGARALSITCSKLSLWLMVLSFAVLSLVGLLVPCMLCFCRILKATFDLSIW